jgi:hypothetical protein
MADAFARVILPGGFTGAEVEHARFSLVSLVSL